MDLDEPSLSLHNRLLTCEKSRRCVVENTSFGNGIEYAPCIPKEVEDEMLERVEYWWNLSYRSLNVNTRYNFIPLSYLLEGLFHKGLWLLIPEHDVIEMFFSSKGNRDLFPKEILQQKTFTYTLVAHTSMHPLAIHRLTGTDLSLSELDSLLSGNKPEFEHHRYPFQTLGPIESHAHPHFVLYNAGMKLLDPILRSGYTLNSDLEMIIQIYKAWRNPIPPTFVEEEYNESEVSGISDTETTLGRRKRTESEKEALQRYREKKNRYTSAWKFLHRGKQTRQPNVNSAACNPKPWSHEPSDRCRKSERCPYSP
ncbi:hypothetical protein BDQ17DRAFT_1542908 [Cyathus striatus]|nr:hypothetical protein BDQ17DRAFT_1542908 [Cyathus striatus]